MKIKGKAGQLINRITKNAPSFKSGWKTIFKSICVISVTLIYYILCLNIDNLQPWVLWAFFSLHFTLFIILFYPIYKLFLSSLIKPFSTRRIFAKLERWVYKILPAIKQVLTTMITELETTYKKRIPVPAKYKPIYTSLRAKFINLTQKSKRLNEKFSDNIRNGRSLIDNIKEEMKLIADVSMSEGIKNIFDNIQRLIFCAFILIFAFAYINLINDNTTCLDGIVMSINSFLFFNPTPSSISIINYLAVVESLLGLIILAPSFALFIGIMLKPNYLSYAEEITVSKGEEIEKAIIEINEFAENTKTSTSEIVAFKQEGKTLENEWKILTKQIEKAKKQIKKES